MQQSAKESKDRKKRKKRKNGYSPEEQKKAQKSAFALCPPPLGLGSQWRGSPQTKVLPLPAP